jgi:hypothetical protein
LAAIFRLIEAFAYKNSIAAKPLTSKSPDYPPAALRPFCSAIDQGAPLLSSSVAMCHGLPIIWGGRCPQPGYQRQLRRLGYAPRSFIRRRVSVLTVRNGAILLKKSLLDKLGPISEIMIQGFQHR